MNYGTNKYYANEYGMELNEYFKHHFNNAGIKVSSESWQERG